MMMLFLFGNVFCHLFYVGLADWKTGVSWLPSKIVDSLPYPTVGYTFQLLYPVSLGDGSAKTAEYMNMVFHPTDYDRWAIQWFRNSAQKGMELQSQFFVF
jgi:hypothetical protein